tara:strand:+ start:4656 stop:5498 length:843 start_codon:yes stop_codon:yes gene_type:complete
MKLIEFKKHFFDILSNNYDAGELSTIFYLFINHFLNISKIDFLTETEYKINQENLSLFNKKLNELNNDRPIQYVIGKILVSDLTFIVNENVLIPRPETIELCEWIESFNFQDVRILDIGTGSGLIAILLKKKLSKSIVYACDICLKSLQIAKKNASINNLNINFFSLNILKESITKNRYDIIVSNPPYVSLSEKDKMHRRVVEFEPNNAIFVNNNDPLIFYNQIAQKAKESLNKKGFIFFECNSDYVSGVKDILLKNSFSNIEIRSDFRNNKRMIKAQNG